MNRIPFGVGINTNSDSEFFAEFIRHLTACPQHDIESMHDESCLELMNKLILDQLEIEKEQQETDEIKSIVVKNKIFKPSIDEQKFLNYKRLSSKFFENFQNHANNRQYMKQLQVSMASLNAKDPKLDGARPSNIWFDHELMARLKKEYQIVKDIYNEVTCKIRQPEFFEDENAFNIEKVEARRSMAELYQEENDDYPRMRRSTVNNDCEFKIQGKETEYSRAQSDFTDLQSELNEYDIALNNSELAEARVNRSNFSHLQTRQHRHKHTEFKTQIEIVDSYVDNCFDMISDFQDSLGRKGMLDVDFSKIADLENKSEQENNILTATYKYIQQNFMEKLSQLALQTNDKLSFDEKHELARDAQSYFLSKLKQSEILKQLLVNRY